MVGWYDHIRPLLMRLDAEQAHGLALRAMKAGLVPARRAPDDPSLAVTLWDRTFPNPVGLAAGFDKNAEIVGPMFRLGFGFVEAGTVTPQPQAGNPRPRIFRDIAAGAIINRMGFPNGGAERFEANLTRVRQRSNGIIGVNIGMNKDQPDPGHDYCQLVRQLGPMADYLTVNISSPNTPGLRDLQSPETFLELMAAIMAARDGLPGRRPPVLVKLAPDLEEAQRKALAPAILQSGIDGLILTNTTLDRPDSLDPAFAAQRGGLSGRPVRDKSTKSIRHFYRLTNGKLPIIGAGGVSNGADAYAKIRAGASLVQLYSGLVYEGPGVVRAITRDLARLVQGDGLKTINEAVGADA